MGRRPKLTPEQQAAVREILEKEILTTRQLARMYNVAVVTIQQYLPDWRRYGQQDPKTDLTGLVFGQWTVVEPAPRPAHLLTKGAYYRCRCSCGASRVLLAWNLKSGRTRGCPPCALKRARSVQRHQHTADVPHETSKEVE